MREKRSDPVADKLRLTQKHKEIVHRAMRALNSKSPMAKRQSVSLAVKYRRMVDTKTFKGLHRGVYKNTETFKGLHQALSNERKKAVKLARHMDAVTRRLMAVLSHLLGPYKANKIDELIGNRVELARFLDRNTEDIEGLEGYWPKGGNLNLAKAHFGPPKEWLTKQCLKVFWHHHTDGSGIKSVSRTTALARAQLKASKDQPFFPAYVYAVYELATGDSKPPGLDKIINAIVRQWRKNEKKKPSGHFEKTGRVVVYREGH